jgi:hypothetical protein
MEEVLDTMEKIKALEDSIKTVWTKKQMEDLLGQQRMYDKAVNG